MARRPRYFRRGEELTGRDGTLSLSERPDFGRLFPGLWRRRHDRGLAGPCTGFSLRTDCIRWIDGSVLAVHHTHGASATPAHRGRRGRDKGKWGIGALP